MINKLTSADIDHIIEQADEEVWEPFAGITIVSWHLPNGFTITDQSGCVDPANYSREIGVSICREHLRDKVWMLYGFALAELRTPSGFENGVGDEG